MFITRRVNVTTFFLISTVVVLLMPLMRGDRVEAQWTGPDSSNNIYYNGGNVGIGTGSPGAKLEISGATGYNLILNAGNAGSLRWGYGAQGALSWDTGKAIMYALSGNDLSFGANNAFDQFYIKSGGNIGIGTTNPQAPLSIFKSGATATQIHLYNNNSDTQRYSEIKAQFYPTDTSFTSGIRFLKEATGPNYGSGIGFVTELDQATQNIDYAMYIKNRKVGIGTTSPDTTLNVRGANNTWRIGDVYTSSTQYAGISDASPDATSYFLLSRVGVGGGDRYVNAPTGGSLDLQIGGSSAITIPSNRNVGIGTTNPQARLEIAGGAGYDMILNAGNAGSLRWGNGAQAALSWDAGKAMIYGLSGNDLSLGANGAYDQLYIKSSGSVGIGTTNPQSKLHVAGSITVDGNISAKYQDVAEWVPASEQLAAGTVVVLDSTKSNQVTSSSVSYDTRVAGVISEQPGIALGEKSEGKVLVATTGRVHVKVDATKGPIHIGDLLVTSDVPGVAMKSEPVEFAGRKMHMPGTLIGKALEPLEKGRGEILVLLSLQ
jgi:hypothetical protein